MKAQSCLRVVPWRTEGSSSDPVKSREAKGRPLVRETSSSDPTSFITPPITPPAADGASRPGRGEDGGHVERIEGVGRKLVRLAIPDDRPEVWA